MICQFQVDISEVNYKDKIIIDHIIELKEDMSKALDSDNLQTLCLPHHNQKTAWAKAKRKRNGKE